MKTKIKIKLIGRLIDWLISNLQLFENIWMYMRYFSLFCTLFNISKYWLCLKFGYLLKCTHSPFNWPLIGAFKLLKFLKQLIYIYLIWQILLSRKISIKLGTCAHAPVWIFIFWQQILFLLWKGEHFWHNFDSLQCELHEYHKKLIIFFY